MTKRNDLKNERVLEIYYDNTWYTFSWLKALFVNRKRFAARGVKIVFRGPTSFFPMMNRLFRPLSTKEEYLNEFDCKHDVVVLAYHHPLCICGFDPADRVECLKKIRENSSRVVWLDTADSPGTCLFDVLPYVDVYLKKQVYADRSAYTRNLYGDRLYTDFYHRVFSLVDDTAASPSYDLDGEALSKIGVSWNIGISDMFSYNKIKRLFEKNRLQKVKFTPPGKRRAFDIHYRCSFQSGIYGFQRRELFQRLTEKETLDKLDYSVNPHGKEYRREMADSKAVLSPFGFGEICIRDFEAFFSGASLMKPDMNHVETYPDWFVPNVTYLPLKWDFSNTDAAFDAVHARDAQLDRIAENGQDLFKRYRLDPSKQDEFVSHVMQSFGISEV